MSLKQDIIKKDAAKYQARLGLTLGIAARKKQGEIKAEEKRKEEEKKRQEAAKKVKIKSAWGNAKKTSLALHFKREEKKKDEEAEEEKDEV